MKKISYLLFIMLIPAFIITGCSKDSDGDVQIQLPNQSEQTQTGYANDQTTGGFTFVAKAAWTATVAETTPPRASGVSWLRLSLNGTEAYNGGAGTINLVIELDTNYTGETRSATITVKSGNNSITITVTQQGKTKEGLVPENPNPTIEVAGIELNKTELILIWGGNETLTATVTPNEATNKTVIWTSSDETIATVDDNGNVTAIAVGTATIIATTVDGGKTAECTVAVIADGVANGITGKLLWGLTKNGTLIIIGNSAMPDYESEWDNNLKRMTTSAPWYSYYEEIKTVMIADEVTNIGNYAFAGCFGLTDITIPNSITNIGDYAFAGCAGLTDITIPNSVTNIGEMAFKGCSGLTNITIGNGVTSIGDYAFYCCAELTNITIGNSVTNIGNNAFGCCFGLTDITIPNSVTNIGEMAFYACIGLTGITIPDGVTSIEEATFYACTGLTGITIPNSVTNIEGWAFYGCSGLTNITIPNSVTNIGSSAFDGCSGLTVITVKATVPPLAINSFGDINKAIPIYVPLASLLAYENAESWKDFTNLQGI